MRVWTSQVRKVSEGEVLLEDVGHRVMALEGKAVPQICSMMTSIISAQRTQWSSSAVNLALETVTQYSWVVSLLYLSKWRMLHNTWSSPWMPYTVSQTIHLCIFWHQMPYLLTTQSVWFWFCFSSEPTHNDSKKVWVFHSPESLSSLMFGLSDFSNAFCQGCIFPTPSLLFLIWNSVHGHNRLNFSENHTLRMSVA